MIESRHPDPFGRRPRRDFVGEIERLRAQGEQIDRRTTCFALMRMVALAGDAHTRLGSWGAIADIELPARAESGSDGFWIAAVQPDRPELFGRRVEAVGGIPIERVIDRLAPLVPHENDLLLRRGAARLLSLPRALSEVGVLAEGDTVRLALAAVAGARAEVDLSPRPRGELKTWEFPAPVGWQPPIHRVRHEEDWWWTELDEGAVLYLQFNRCVFREDAPFTETAASLLERLDRGGVRRLIVDLRNNGGGNSEVLAPLVDGLAERRERLGTRGIVALTGHATFSSGMLNAWQLQRRCGALLVGEPTSQKPDTFGEVRSVDLPNTGWRLDCSTKRFRLFGDDRPSLAPDVLVPSGFADLLAGRDPTLERALALDP